MPPLHLGIILIVLAAGRPALSAPAELGQDPNVPFVEKAVAALSPDDFLNDPILVRSKLGEKVFFANLPAYRNGTTVFRQKRPSDPKDVLVISGFDDQIRRGDGEKTEQRTYVVLRRAPKPDHYYVNYVYVR
jgi:hypothetical protein